MFFEGVENGIGVVLEGDERNRTIDAIPTIEFTFVCEIIFFIDILSYYF